MLTVRLYGTLATFSESTFEWDSEDELVLDSLTQVSEPLLEDMPYSAPFMKKGIAGLLWDGLKDTYGKQVKKILLESPPPPAEADGELY
jgi:hypothetical protein